ncbi:MAG: hypothetical protein NT121_07170 [Chloroflexi bacterium]|nr:hypothetical protein [Chloroflexota bacterium]
MGTEAPQYAPVEQPKKSKTGLIIGIVVAVILCCCCVIIIGAAVALGPTIGNVFSSVNDLQKQLTAMPEIPLAPSAPDGTEEPSRPVMPTISPDVIPQGGLGDDVLRAQAWAYSLFLVATSGCTSPVAKDTTIEVTSKPDSSGVWQEHWTIACDGDSPVPVDITFTPSSSGGTDISVKLSK